jgi:hypothetical protein
MGYEVKMFAGRVSPRIDDNGHWLEVVAMFDLCCPGSGTALARLAEASGQGKPVYIYQLDGNTATTEDGTGKRLRAIPANEVIAALDNDMRSDSYWRFKAAVSLLRSLVVSSAVPIHVALYGY